MLCALPSEAFAVISDGSAAVNLIGQYDETSYTDPQPDYTVASGDNKPNRRGMNGPIGSTIDTVHHRLFVADSANNRVLVYNLDDNNILLDELADAVLGQSDFRHSAAATTQAGMSSPQALAYDSSGDRLFVADVSNNRVLVFDVASITNGENAVYVLGQSTFTTATAATTQAGMSTPRGVAYSSSGSRLFVADQVNSRVLVFDVTSITNGENAELVLGQSLFTTSTAATTQVGMSNPFSVAYDETNERLFVGDTSNNRILVYTGSSLSSGMTAAKVLGQANFTTATAALTQSGLSGARAIVYDSVNQRLFVSMVGYHRVLVFDVASISDGENATAVLGQTDFTSSSSAITQAGMFNPRGMAYDPTNQYLYLGSQSIHRVTVYDVTSITNGENAVDALGQFDDSISNPQPVYTKNGISDLPGRYGFNFSTNTVAQAVALDSVNHRLFVADTGNHRVLVYNMTTANVLQDRIPDYVLGQSNFYTATSANSQSSFQSPQNVAYDAVNNRLFVGSAAGNRVLVFDVTSITDGENATNVLGQTDFTTVTAGTTQSKMSAPSGMAYDPIGSRLFVSDATNHRVLIFDVASITDGENAVNVLGPSDFTTASAATTQSKLSTPAGLAYNGSSELFVVDGGNHRVMVFEVASITDGENAINVIGQIDFTTATTATTASSFSTPRGAAYDSTNDRLFVSDFTNNRILVFDTSAITDGEDAVNVFGQTDFVTATSATTQSGLGYIRAVAYEPTSGYLYAVDNQRVMVFDASLPSSSSSSSSSIAETVSQSGGGRRGTPGRGGEAPSIDMTTHTFSSAVSSAEPVQVDGSDDIHFGDVTSTAWYFNVVNSMVAKKIISGYADANGIPLNRFGPSDPVTVGQIIKIALLTGGHELPIPTGIPRNKTATDWSAPYVALAERRQLALASENVSRIATRGEVIEALLQAMGVPVTTSQSSFTDLSSSNPHADAITTAARLGIVRGDTDAEGNETGTVRPDDKINRAEVAALVMRILDVLEFGRR